jgi:hypothetical protein
VDEAGFRLDSDSLRRQANTVVRLTVVRLTVVTTLGLIGTVATGFLGMNLIAAADEPFSTKVFYFVLTLIPTTILTLHTVSRSKALGDFLETVSEERLGWREKLRALGRVWTRR